MTFMFLLACGQESKNAQEIEAAEKKVSETISSIVETMANNEAELAALEAELEAAKSKNASLNSSEQMVLSSCSDICEIWLKKPEATPTFAHDFFQFHTSVAEADCLDETVDASVNNKSCRLGCSELCDLAENNKVFMANFPARP